MGKANFDLFGATEFILHAKKLNKSSTAQMDRLTNQQQSTYYIYGMNIRSRFFTFLLMACLWHLNAWAQTTEAPVFSATLNDIVISDKRHFKNDTDLYRYNQLKYYVSTVIPYANEAIRLFHELKQETQSMNNRERKLYIRSQERAIKLNFEDQLKQLNITQGRLLVKLINRQLQMPCFQIIKDLKNPLSASYYQTWASLNGIPLNKAYVKEEEPDLEQALRALGF